MHPSPGAFLLMLSRIYIVIPGLTRNPNLCKYEFTSESNINFFLSRNTSFQNLINHIFSNSSFGVKSKVFSEKDYVVQSGLSTGNIISVI